MSNNVDITSLVIITNFDKNEKKQEVQQLFCHILCLKTKLPETVPLYGLEQD